MFQSKFSFKEKFTSPAVAESELTIRAEVCKAPVFVFSNNPVSECSVKNLSTYCQLMFIGRYWFVDVHCVQNEKLFEFTHAIRKLRHFFQSISSGVIFFEIVFQKTDNFSIPSILTVQKDCSVAMTFLSFSCVCSFCANFCNAFVDRYCESWPYIEESFGFKPKLSF